MSAPPTWGTRLGLIALGTLLAALAGIAATVERAPEEALRPGEGTTWAQASSLAHDLDLAYTREDYDRLVATHGAVPADLELISGSGGKRISFDRPFPLALWNAPFVALSPRRGLYYAHVALLLLAVVALYRTLRRRIGAQAVVWSLALVAGTLLFAQVPRGSSEGTLALFALLAGCLAASSHPVSRDFLSEVYAVPEEGGMATRWALAGAFLAVAIAFEPTFAALLVALFLTVPDEGRGAARRGLIVGTLLCLVAIALVELWTTGGLPLVGTSRFRFTASTGFPAVDFPAPDWDATVRRLQAIHWEGAPRWSWSLDPRLLGWNAAYFLAGREVGLLVTAPAALLLFGVASRVRRGGLAFGFGVWVLVLLLARPFRFHGDPGSMGNELLLVALALVWPLGAGRFRPGVAVAIGAVVAALLFPQWMAPVAGSSVESPVAARLLPEVTQRWIGGPDGFLAGHHARILSGDGWIESRRDRVMVAGRSLELMIAGGPAVESLLLVADERMPSALTVAGAEAGVTTLRSDGGFERLLAPEIRGRIHPMWWTPEPQRIAVLRLELPEAPEEPLPVRLLPGPIATENEP